MSVLIVLSVQECTNAMLLYRQACAILEQINAKKNKLPPECYAKQDFDLLKHILEPFQWLSAI